ALLIGNFVQTEGRLKYIVGAFLVCGSLMTFTQLFRINQPFLNDRGLWGLWTVLPAYGLLLAIPQMRWRWRLALLGLIAVTMYQTAVVNADWVSGWLPTVVGMFVATFLRSKKAFVILLVVGVIGAY